jgi:transcription initiation factor TFIID subunit TAF12
MPLRRFGRPGLIGLAARTAVVAGTATAVGGAMADRRQRRAQDEYEQEQYEAAQQQAQVDAAAQNAAAQYASPPSAPRVDIVAELQKLTSLKEAGALSDDEFAAAKTRLLA